ncbi:hypothetical protein ABBQ38_002919 [Trebouxia sp. C0009 RCD-2024]
MTAKKAVIISTSQATYPNSGDKIGVWAEELMAPYYVFAEAGYDVTIASIKGGEIPVDEASLQGDFKTADVTKFWADDIKMKLLKESVALDSISGKEYDIVFVPGGHGIMFDGPGNKKLAAVLTEAYASGKVIAAVCHGPAGMVDATGSDGKSVFNGKRVTGFCNTEEEAVGKTDKVPFLLEDRMKALGGKYEKKGDWNDFSITDGRLVTGQNPQSSASTARKAVEAAK